MYIFISMSKWNAGYMHALANIYLEEKNIYNKKKLSRSVKLILLLTIQTLDSQRVRYL